MNICLVSPYFPRPCGIASYTHYLAEALSLTSPFPSITLLAEKPACLEPGRAFNLVEGFCHEGDYPNQILSQLEAIRPDIVHFQHEYGIFGYGDRFLMLLRQLYSRGVRTVVTLHSVHTRLSMRLGCVGYNLSRQLRKVNIEEYQFQIGELADRVIVHQENTRQALLRMGLSSQRVRTIPHGTRILAWEDVDQAKANLGIEPSAPLILSFGFLEPSKNLTLLLKAFSQVKDRVPDAKLWLSGYFRFPSSQATAYRERCLKLINTLRLEQDVIFTNQAVPEEQVLEVIAAADVTCFVYNEDTRSSSGALHLALGLGKAVVATRIPKFQELATEVSDEILVDPHSPSELSRLLVRLLQDQPFRETMKERVSTYAQKTSWLSVAMAHQKVYEELLLPDDIQLMIRDAVAATSTI